MAKDYYIESSPAFTRDYKKLSKDKYINLRIAQCISTLRKDPFSVDLRTHQVNTSSLGKVWSSRVTGDLRLLWIFNEKEQLVIIALRLQGHDTVYK